MGRGKGSLVKLGAIFFFLETTRQGEHGGPDPKYAHLAAALVLRTVGLGQTWEGGRSFWLSYSYYYYTIHTPYSLDVRPPARARLLQHTPGCMRLVGYFI